MLNGSFALGGGDPLPMFGFYENIVGARDKGQISLQVADLTVTNVNIPSRDKSVDLFSNCPQLPAFIETIDSSFPGMNYQTKLAQLQRYSHHYGMVLNKGTHGSFALFGKELEIIGLYDTELKNSYLTWSSDGGATEMIRAYPLRFLVYRFPRLYQPVFVQAEAVCSKWWRWLRTHQSHLHAFNALEHKLFGHP